MKKSTSDNEFSHVVAWDREVRRIAGPAIVQSIAATAVFAVDRIMLGHAGREALASMQIAGPLEWSIISIFSAFEVAAVARVGAHFGAGKEDETRHASRMALLVALVAGVLVALVTPAMLGLLSLKADPAVPLAISYLRTTLTASPLVFLALAFLAIFQARGDTRTPMVVSFLVNVVHVFTNRILILGGLGVSPLGVRGAGYSTALTFALAAGALGIVAYRRGWLSRPAVAALPGGEFASMLRVGLPALVERGIYHLGFLGFVWLISGLGEVAMAANQILIAIESVCFNAADGFGAATASTIARAKGANEPGAEAAVLRQGARDGVLTLLLCGVAVVLFRRQLLGAFGDDPAVFAVALSAIPVLAVAQPWMGGATVFASALRGVGETKSVLAVSTVGAFFVRLSATWFFAYKLHWGLVGIWLGSTCDWAARTVLLSVLVRRRFAPRGPTVP